MQTLESPRLWLATVLLAVAAIPIPTRAQSDPVQADKAEKVKAEPDGPPSDWTGSLSIGGNANVTSNEDVVGQTDGLYQVYGLTVSGETTYRNRADGFRGQLLINETFAQTPSIGQFVKNTDSVDVEGIYNRYLLSWSGLFGRLGVQSTIFENFSVTGSPRAYRIARPDGSVSTRSATTRFQLSDAFRPTSLNQSIGLFASPYESTEFNLRTRLGVGARETFARGVLVVDDDEETSELDVRELESVYQGGVQAFVGANGSFPERNLTYEAGATGLLPILNNDPEDRSAVDLTRVGVTAGLTFAAFDWLSTSYNLEVTRDLQLVDATQVQHNVLLTLKYDLISEQPSDDEPTADEKLEEAQDRIKTLEERIQQMEADDGESNESEQSDDSSSE